MESKPIAVVCADLHLSLKQPACRADDDWMEVQAHYLNQLNSLADTLCVDRTLPVLCAGDIFDRWNPPPELIHFALTHLPDQMICVPGQHDLPNHRIEDMRRSGYGVLAASGKIIDLAEMGTSKDMDQFRVYGFGWGQDIGRPFPYQRETVNIAIVHTFIWMAGRGYPGAPAEGLVTSLASSLKGYDIAVFGDNHRPFQRTVNKKKTTVFNCGTFIRRKSDEVDHPRVGIVYDDGKIESYPLDTRKDRFHDRPEEMEQLERFDMAAFLNTLEALGEQAMNYREIIKNDLASNKTLSPETRALVWKALTGDSYES